MISISNKGHSGIVMMVLGLGSVITGLTVNFYNDSGVAWAWGMLSAIMFVAGLALFFWDVSDQNVRREKEELRVSKLVQDVEVLKGKLEKEEEIGRELQARDDEDKEG